MGFLAEGPGHALPSQSEGPDAEVGAPLPRILPINPSWVGFRFTVRSRAERDGCEDSSCSMYQASPCSLDAYGVATDLEGAMSIGVFWGDTLALLPCPTLTFSTLGGLAIFICSQIPLITASCTCFTASPAVLRSRTGGRPDGPRSSHLTSVREKLRIPQAGSPQPSVSPYHAVSKLSIVY